MLALAASAPASPYVHAHRGGPLETRDGKLVPAEPENSLPAFKRSARRGFVLEMDTRITAEGRIVVMHDESLDRTTDCEGDVIDYTLAKLRRCRIDILGTEGVSKRLGPRDDRRTRIPTLREALKVARRADVAVNLEINNYPGQAGFDSTYATVRKTIREVRASRFPPSELIVQSFWPPNLDVVEGNGYLASASTSYLSFSSGTAGAPALADANGYEFISPQWPVESSVISQAHELGLRVVPFTLDTASDIKRATRRGVDALITNDPGLGRKAVAAVSPEAPPIPKPPSKRTCRQVAADKLATPIESFHPDNSGPRVFALQFKQDLENVKTYKRFRAKVECMIREYVRPRLADDRPNVIALTEDVGLMTLATGSRGRATRETFADGGVAPGCENAPSPCGVAYALTTLGTAYAEQVAAYQARYDGIGAFARPFVAGTDTFARGWMQTFSDMARRYDVYILGSNNQAPFRESVDPTEIDTFADPDQPRPESVYVATDPEVYNEVFMWGPNEVTKEGPVPLRNVVAQNKKVPLTDIEKSISLTPGPSTGPDGVDNVDPYRLPGSKAKISFATSLPAFVYNGGPVSPYGEAPPASVDPCTDTSKYYMYCLEKLGTNLVMQDEANPGRWATGGDFWQPLEWMGSTWRSSTDPTVDFDYNVTPHMVGNLADLPFDGQSAITQRGLKGPRGDRRSCNYVGNSSLLPSDPPDYEVYSGPKREFLGLADWVVRDGSRGRLRDVSAELDAGSGAARENDYLETAIVADLPYPVDAKRPNCNGGSVTVRGSCANLHVGSDLGEPLIGTDRGDRVLGLAGGDRIRGGDGADCLKGQDGADSLLGGNGSDALNGGRGDDVIRARNKGVDRIRCGSGRDKVFAGPRDRIQRSSCERVRIG